MALTKQTKCHKLLSLLLSRPKLRERGGLDGLIWGGTAALATHDWEPRSPSRVHIAAAVQHAQAQHLSQPEVELEKTKENNSARGERERGDTKALGECLKDAQLCPFLYFSTPAIPRWDPPFQSRTASHALPSSTCAPLQNTSSSPSTGVYCRTRNTCVVCTE